MLKKRKVINLKVRIYKAALDEKHKGWIRVSDDLRKDSFGQEISNGAYVKLIANDRSVYCQIRGTQGEYGRVEINEWYRNALGWNELPNEEVELTIKEVYLFGRLDAFAYHPDDIVRVGISLGMISVGLGLLSLVLAISLTGVTYVVLRLVIAFIALFALSKGIVILFRRFPKPIDQKDSN